MNESRTPNRLIHASSPYLRQHAYNPVDWYPWCEEALVRARSEKKPIFLSVGYSSCHWCHVMERESFENENIAALMNRLFVNIKVDREERPDIDATYMAAVQMLTGQGGWPMSVFLTPDLRPFWGGTYFPPESKWGRPGFGAILSSLAAAFRDEPEKIESSASAIAKSLREKARYGGDLPGVESIGRAVEEANRRFDPMFGGFGSAPKFPRSVEISLLLRAWKRSGDERALHMCEHTLEHMARGGMYDQLGGGFHRYSVDAQWLVPHFEKMLYDNALLASTYVEAFLATGKSFYSRVARETLDYVLREMTDEAGGFYSATDADSEGEEGTFFVWTREEALAVLGEEDGPAFCRFHDISDAGNFEGKNILHVPHSLEAIAKAEGLEPGALRDLLERGRARLFDARERREKPFRDEKILTAWNGLMISALALGAQSFGDDRYREAAERAAHAILAARDADGRLHRIRKDGVVSGLGFLDDYAYFTVGLIDLYETSFDASWLDAACALADLVIAEFADEEDGGFFFSSTRHEELLARRKDDLDNATPSPGACMAWALVRLERLTGRVDYRERAEEFLRSVAKIIDQLPMASGQALITLDFLSEGAVELAVLGESDSEAYRELLAAARSGFLPARVVSAATQVDAESLAERIPLLAGKRTGGAAAAAWICRDGACQAPVSTAEELRAALGFAARTRG